MQQTWSRWLFKALRKVDDSPHSNVSQANSTNSAHDADAQTTHTQLTLPEAKANPTVEPPQSNRSVRSGGDVQPETRPQSPNEPQNSALNTYSIDEVGERTEQLHTGDSVISDSDWRPSRTNDREHPSQAGPAALQAIDHQAPNDSGDRQSQPFVALKKLHTKHERLLQHRVGLSEQWEALRQHSEVQRRETEDLFRELMGLLEPLHLESKTALEARVARQLTSHQEQVHLESSMDTTFVSIVSEEFQVAELESRVYSAALPKHEALAQLSTSVDHDEEDTRDGNEERRSTAHKIEKPSSDEDLMSLLGDRELLIEQKDELVAEKEYLDLQRNRRLAFGLSLDDASITTLARFDGNYERLQKEISVIETKIDMILRHRSEGENDLGREWVASSAIEATTGPRVSTPAPLKIVPNPPETLKSHTEGSFLPSQGLISANLVFEERRQEKAERSDLLDAWLQQDQQRFPGGEQARHGGMVGGTIRRRSWTDLHSRWLRSEQPGTPVINADDDEGEEVESAGMAGGPFRPTHSDPGVSQLPKTLPLLRIDANTPASSIILRARQQLQMTPGPAKTRERSAT